MKNIGRLLADLIKDGFSVVGVLAPLLSISITVSKALNVPLAALGVRYVTNLRPSFSTDILNLI